MATDIEQAPSSELVAEADTGGRKPTGLAGSSSSASRWPGRCSSSGTPRRCPSCSASACSTTPRRARSIWRSRCSSPSSRYPAFKSSPRDRIPLLRLGARAAPAHSPAPICSCSTASSPRGPGQPTPDRHRRRDHRHRAAARSHAPRGRPADADHRDALPRLHLARPLHARVLAHKGASLDAAALAPSGSRPKACSASRSACRRSFIFLFVLFGALLDHAGAGNYMMQVSLRAARPPARRPGQGGGGVLGLNGMISGSSVANVVSGGIFTIPLMKKAGYGGVKAGAIETHALGQRPDHAAGDGRGGVPDGRVCRHPLHRDRASTPSCRRCCPTSRCSTSCISRR